MRTIPKKGPEGAESAIRARGLRLTGPRRVVLDVVRSTESHPTAEWVHRMVRRRLPRVSLGTVFFLFLGVVALAGALFVLRGDALSIVGLQ